MGQRGAWAVCVDSGNDSTGKAMAKEIDGNGDKVVDLGYPGGDAEEQSAGWTREGAVG
jgi:hypothetical protein